jgi:Fe-S oxidoreductase
MRMMTKGLKQSRLGWLRRGLEVVERSDTLYFVGCLPYFEVMFQELGFPGHKIARSTVKALNRLGITPMVLGNERCCGHDLLWEGEIDDFRRLAELNLKIIEESGAQRVVTSCAECYHTLAVDYPRYVGGLRAEVIHISEILVQGLPTPKRNRAPTTRVTYQDPCRLGRFSGLYEPPRQVIASLPGVELVEMERNRAQALCCGTSCWTNCGADNKEIQVERLREAKATGADLLITACPKCQIHFRCAMRDEKVDEEARIEVEDLVVLAANAF